MSPPSAGGTDIAGVPGLAERVVRWDAAVSAVRAVLREGGMREVSTPVRVEAVALEPYIEPIWAGEGLLITSPELAMKRLLCEGSGPIFQVAQVLRAGEVGALHAPEFHLVEWYRTTPSLAGLHADVERLVAALAEALARHGVRTTPPARWERWGFEALFEATTGIRVSPHMPLAQVRDVADRLGQSSGVAPLPSEGPSAPQVEALWTWSALHAVWSDAALDPWLAARPELGVHIDAFPPALAALATIEDGVALRTESYACGLEISNGYVELRSELEQRRRFEVVAGLRAYHGQSTLPMPEGFLSALAQDAGLPPCAGMAMGLERVLVAVTGATTISEVRPDLHPIM